MSDCRLELITEPLEQRRMLAGNVTAVINGAGDLVITGDNQNNFVRVETNASGQFELSSYDFDTLINGQAAGTVVTLTPTGPLRDLKIVMKGGDDLVEFAGREGATVFRRSTATMGSGDDEVYFDDVRFTDRVRIVLGAGDNSGYQYFEMFDETVIDRDLIVRGAATDDTVLIFGVVNGRTSIATGGGTDDVGLRDATLAGPVTVNTGGGNDYIDTRSISTFDRITFIGGGGNDKYRVFTDRPNEHVVNPVFRTIEEYVTSS